MCDYNIDFHQSRPLGRAPHVSKVMNYTYNEETKEGVLEMGGYFYIHDDDFPVELKMHVRLVDDIPARVEERRLSPTNTVSRTIHRILEEHTYDVCVYAREKFERYNVPPYEEPPADLTEEEKEEYNICFFPEHRQKLYFRVLKVCDTYKWIKPRYVVKSR